MYPRSASTPCRSRPPIDRLDEIGAPALVVWGDQNLSRVQAGGQAIASRAEILAIDTLSVDGNRFSGFHGPGRHQRPKRGGVEDQAS